MRAVRSTPPGVEVVDVPDPEPGEGTIAVRSASICASDLGYISWGSTFVLGHELAGTTADGAPVVVEAMFGCGTCEWCREGSFNLCAQQAAAALGFATDGGMSDWFTAPAGNLVPVPDGLELRDASLVEPASVAWHGLETGGAGPETTVAVVGGGAIGLLAVAAAQEMGAADVALAARHPHQLEARDRLGASEPKGEYDVVIEAGGSESALLRAIELVRPNGTVVLLSVHSPDTPFPYVPALLKQAHVVPSIGYCRHGSSRDFEETAAMLARRPGLVSTLITHRFPLEDAPEAFRVAGDKSTGAIRVVLEP